MFILGIYLVGCNETDETISLLNKLHVFRNLHIKVAKVDLQSLLDQPSDASIVLE